MITDDTPVTEDLAELKVRARGLVIRTAEDYTRVATFLLGIKALRAKIAATFDEHIARAHEAHRALLKEKREAEAAAIDAEDIAKDLLARWEQGQRAAADIERQRLETERREQLATIEAQATFAELTGDLQRADALREQRTQVAAPLPVVPTTPKVEGITYRETWSAKIVDLALLVRAAGTHAPWLALLQPNMPALNAQARSLRGRLQIPGVEAVRSRTVGASRGRSDD